MQVSYLYIGDDELVLISGEGSSGFTPGDQLRELGERLETQLQKLDFSLKDAVFHRLWLRSRDHRDDIATARANFFSTGRRTASSSFIDKERWRGSSTVAIDLIVLVPKDKEQSRLVDFNPPRRYAHYLRRGDWLFMSGMAEEASDLKSQFAASLNETEKALRAEEMNWSDVLDVRLFIERDFATPEWIRQEFMLARPDCAARIMVEEVDGLASVTKNLEIEIIAKKSSC